jgi:hypothetical protein
MKYFDTVDTKEALDNYSYSTRQSTVVRAKDTNDIKINGINVIVDIPAPGDLLCITKYMDGDSLKGPDEQKIVWIKGSTINAATFPADIYEAVGVVYKVQGRHAWVIYKDAPEYKFADITRYAVNNIQSGNIHLEGTVKTASKIINFDFGDVYVDKTNLYQTYNNIHNALTRVADNIYFSAQYHSVADQYIYINCKDDVNTKCTLNYLGDLTNVTCKTINNDNNNNDEYNILCNNNLLGDIVGANYDGYYELAKLYGNNPISLVDPTEYEDIPVSLAAFEENNNCRLLRNEYTTYDNYIKSYLMKWPCNYGNSCVYSNSRTITKSLSNTNLYYYLDPATQKNSSIFLAAIYANKLSVNQSALTEGNWYIPSAVDLFEIYSTYNDDIKSVYNKLANLNFNSDPAAEDSNAIKPNKTIYWTSTENYNGSVSVGNFTTICHGVNSVITPSPWLRSSNNYLYSNKTMCITDFDF